MRYYIDTEFDGHGGALLSLAIVTDGLSAHFRTRARATSVRKAPLARPRPSRLAKIIGKTVVGALVLVASAWGVAWVVAVWP